MQAFDYLIYGEASGAAIIKRVSFAEIEAFSVSCSHVARFLRLHLFEETFMLKHLFSRLNSEPVMLRSSTGIAVAKIMHFFGIGPDSNNEKITHFIRTLLQNWQVKASSGEKTSRAIRSFVEEFAGDAVHAEQQLKAQLCAHEAMTTNWMMQSKKRQ